MKKIIKIVFVVCLVVLSNTIFAQLSTTIIANTDNVKVTYSGSVSYDVLCNDTYISLDSVSVSINTTASNGSVIDNGNGSFTYTNGGNYENDTITYILSHDNNGNSDNGFIYIENISIAPTNTSPIATNDLDSAYMGLEIIVSVLSNDIDADGDTLIVLNVGNGNNGTCTTNGTTITYTPNDTMWAGFDTITYILTDGNGANDTAIIYIQSGSTAQINSYNILEPYFGIQMTMYLASSNKMTLYSDGTLSQVGSGPTYTLPGARWDLKTNGDIYFPQPSGVCCFYVAPFSFQSGIWYYGYTFGGIYNYFTL